MNAEVYLRSGKIIKLKNISRKEESDLTSGLDSLSSENRIFVGEWTFDGKAVDAVRLIKVEDDAE